MLEALFIFVALETQSHLKRKGTAVKRSLYLSLFVMVMTVLMCICTSVLCAEPLASNTRYGFGNLFDHRSSYGKGTFPEPFLVDDSDLEVNELRFDWFHQQGKGQITDHGRVEFEKGFGLMTLELEAPYDVNSTRTFDSLTRRTKTSREKGFGNFSLGVRHPIYQYVSDDESIDNTFGAAFELGIPTNTPLSKHTEFVPKIFNDLRIGDHFTVQTVLGYSFVSGSAPEGGSQTFEYGLIMGYSIGHKELPLPGVNQLIPIFELRGDTAMNHGAGHDSLLGNAGFRLNLRAMGSFQPRLGIGYVFPIDKGAKDNSRWGIYTSLVFEW